MRRDPHSVKATGGAVPLGSLQAVNPARAERWPRLRPWIVSWSRQHVTKRMMSGATGGVEALRSARPLKGFRRKRRTACPVAEMNTGR